MMPELHPFVTDALQVPVTLFFQTYETNNLNPHTGKTATSGNNSCNKICFRKTVAAFKALEFRKPSPRVRFAG
jgi:hypothetical protein